MVAIDSYDIKLSDIGAGVEPYYFYILNLILSKKYVGLPKTNKEEDFWTAGFEPLAKIKDEFAASEMSSFWGDFSRRRSEQEQRAMQLMGTMNGMIKDLFKILRELSTINERLEHYELACKGEKEGDLVTKDIWVTLVEGGVKNPSSVTGLASQVGFITLPDLFYTTLVEKKEDINKMVDPLDVNDKVKTVLKRKLMEYITWRDRITHELQVRKKFIQNMLKTMITQIRLYADWVRPYLKTINRLKSSVEGKPELVTAFETAVLDVQLQGFLYDKNTFGRYIPSIKATFKQVTSPQKAYQSNYQPGFVHTGLIDIALESCLYTVEEVLKLKQKQDEELLDFLIQNVDESIASLKEDLKQAMSEDYEKIFNPKSKQEKPKQEKITLKEKYKTFINNVFPMLNPLLNRQKKEPGRPFLKMFDFKTPFTDAKQKSAAMIKAGGEMRYADSEKKDNHVWKSTMKVAKNKSDLWSCYNLFKIEFRMLRPP